MLAPIEASMDVVELGETAAGVPVVVSSVALGADAVILINRVKPHTDFGSPVLGSGLLKMSAIGLGKAEGAFRCHRAASVARARGGDSRRVVGRAARDCRAPTASPSSRTARTSWRASR